MGGGIKVINCVAVAPVLLLLLVLPAVVLDVVVVVLCFPPFCPGTTCRLPFVGAFVSGLVEVLAGVLSSCFVSEFVVLIVVVADTSLSVDSFLGCTDSC